MQFDADLFIRGRMNGEPLTDGEKKDFSYWEVQERLSMVRGMQRVVNATNTPQFFALPKQIQAQAMTALDGKNLLYRWNKTKIDVRNKRMELIEKVMKLYKCGFNDAQSYIDSGALIPSDVDDLYSMIYDPQKWLAKNAQE